MPDFFIFGMAPSSGMLSPVERLVMLDAIAQGMSIVNGLHEFLNDDPEFAAAAALHGVAILDVRRPRDKKDLRMFSGRIAEVTCPRIAVLGTDGAIGKRTTATILTQALNDPGIRAVMVGTGQTGLIQGARYGVALDAIPCQFCSGEIEAAVVEAFEGEHPDVIIVEGQGALSHPAYLTSSFILRGSLPDGGDPPARTGAHDQLGDFPERADAHGRQRDQPHPDLRRHEGHRDHDQPREHDRRRGLRGDRAATSACSASRPPTRSTRSPDRLVDMVFRAFPELEPRAGRRREVTTPAARDPTSTASTTTPARLVGRLGARGISVTGVTKATLGSPELGA